MALPLMTTFCVILWLGYLATDVTLWPSFVLFLVSTYFMVELNNRNSLMRQYSRMVSCSYMALMMMCPWIILDKHVMVAQLCCIATVSLLFTTYQDRSLTGRKLWAYAFYGLSVILWPPLIILLPFYWIAEAFFLMSYSGKAFAASLFGILMPMWILAPAVVFFQRFDMVMKQVDMIVPNDRMVLMFNDVSQLWIETLPLPLPSLCIIVFVLLLLLTGVIHYFRHSYIDKIQTRMYYQFFTLLAAALTLVLVGVILLPCETLPGATIVFAMIIVCTSPLIAHYITFTNTRLTNISVIILLIAVLSVDVTQCVLRNAQSVITLLQSYL